MTTSFVREERRRREQSIRRELIVDKRALLGVLVCATLAWSGAVMATPPQSTARMEPLSEAIKAEMRGRSWREGCPVSLEDLRLLTLPYVDYDQRDQLGELVVHKDVAAQVLQAFTTLYAARFPIEKMRRIDAYAGSDDASMEDNNTSAFNCRPVLGRPGVFSKHAYGVAVDINPRTNPYVKGEVVAPPSGRPYLDRSRSAPGLIRAGDAAVRAFTAIGWRWGGAWRTLKDYQHFEARTRPRRR